MTICAVCNLSVLQYAAYPNTDRIQNETIFKRWVIFSIYIYCKNKFYLPIAFDTDL